MGLSMSLILLALVFAIAGFGGFGILLVAGALSARSSPELFRMALVVVLPAVVVGALLGGGAAALISASLSRGWLFWGPLLGLAGGALLGLVVGALITLARWRRG